MAFDGITVSAIVHELRQTCLDGRISKIAQPEKDELMLTIKTSRRENGGSLSSSQCKIVLSANPTLPLVYITQQGKSRNCSRLLHVLKKACPKREDNRYLPAGF